MRQSKTTTHARKAAHIRDRAGPPPPSCRQGQGPGHLRRRSAGLGTGMAAAQQTTTPSAWASLIGASFPGCPVFSVLGLLSLPALPGAWVSQQGTRLVIWRCLFFYFDIAVNYWVQPRYPLTGTSHRSTTTRQRHEQQSI